MANITIDFEVGDIVSLNSGSPEMTITKIREDGIIETTWFERSNFDLYIGDPHVASFEPGALTIED